MAMTSARVATTNSLPADIEVSACETLGKVWIQAFTEWATATWRTYLKLQPIGRHSVRALHDTRTRSGE